MSEPALMAHAKIGTRLGLGTEILRSQLEILPEGNLVGLVRFSSMPRVLAPLTREKTEVGRLLDRITPEKTPLDAQTNLVDALVEGLTRVLAVPSRAQRIILWTDGEANVRANASGWSLNTAADAIRAFGVELIIVDGGPSLEDLEGEKKTRQTEAKALLADLAKASGGRLLGASDPIPPPRLGSHQEPVAYWSPIIRMVSGWLLALFGVGIWLFGNRYNRTTGALARSILWPNTEIRAFRGMTILSTLGLISGLAGLGLFLWNGGPGSQPRGILVDVQQGMLAGQPTRLEQSRTLLERALQYAQPTGELGLWVMGSHPVCVMAPTEDWGAIADELDRLEAWAEESLVWGPEETGGLPLPRRGICFWDGRDQDPFENGLPWGWSVVDMASGGEAKAERFGETRILKGDPDRIRARGSWGRTISRTAATQDGLSAIGQFLGPDKGFFWTRSLWATGLIAFLLTAIFPRPGAVAPGSLSLPSPRSKPRSRPLIVPGLVVLIGCMGILGSLRAQEPGETQKTLSKWISLQEKLESLKGLGAPERESVARDLIRQLEQIHDTDDPQWSKMNFLARAALWRAQRRTDAPHGPGQGDSPKPENTQPGIKPFPEEKDTQIYPIPGSFPMVEGPEGSRTPPLAGFGDQQSEGLWMQLREAQKKVAREVTTRRLSRILPRPWNTPTPGPISSQETLP